MTRHKPDPDAEPDAHDRQPVDDFLVLLDDVEVALARLSDRMKEQKSNDDK